MRDVFEFVGFPMSEAMVFGLDATMGFGFFDKSNRYTDVTEENIPFFLGGKQGTISPTSLACRILGIDLRKQSFTSADMGWEEAKKQIDQDIPLIIQTDLYYLDYFTFEDNVHFGGHSIVLVGYDEEKNTAYVADTEFKELQEIGIERLKQARSSDYGPTFLKPKNTQYSMSLRDKRPPLSAGIKLSIQQVCKNMLRASLSNNGIQGLKMFAQHLTHWKETLKGTIQDPYNDKEKNLAQFMFELTHAYIEEWGTGGACFRKLYLDFLKELQDHPKMRSGPRPWTKEDFHTLHEVIPLIENSVESWTKLATLLKNSAEEFQDKCLKHINIDELQQYVHNIIQNEEEAFLLLSKIKN
jgi:hypothetical protein